MGVGGDDLQHPRAYVGVRGQGCVDCSMRHQFRQMGQWRELGMSTDFGVMSPGFRG